MRQKGKQNQDSRPEEQARRMGSTPTLGTFPLDSVCISKVKAASVLLLWRQFCTRSWVTFSHRSCEMSPVLGQSAEGRTFG